MPWFKVSDDLPSKPETTRIPRAHRTSAIGLWALAGAWSAQQLTDGHIPRHMVDELAGRDEDAAWLVNAGYWEVVDDGWRFVVWAPEQPLREAVLEQRRKNAEKVKNWRSRNRGSNSVTNRGTNPGTNQHVTLPPSRPDPTRPDPTPETDSGDYLSHVTQGDARASDDDEFIHSEFTKLGITSPGRRARAGDAIRSVLPGVGDAVVVDVAREILLLATAPVQHPVPYIEKACRESAAEVAAIWRRLNPPRLEAAS